MSIRSDLVNEVLHQMRNGKDLWLALLDAREGSFTFTRYWKSISRDAQLLIIKHIEELAAKGATSGS